jgi:hypothetical protein
MPRSRATRFWSTASSRNSHRGERYSARIDTNPVAVVVSALSFTASLRRCEPVREECKDLIAGCDRRLTGLVDQMLGHDTVRGRDKTREEWRHIGIRCTIRKNPAYEAIAKRLYRLQSVGPCRICRSRSDMP